MGRPTPCRKVRYSQEVEAKIALARIIGKARTGRERAKTPCRVYRCPKCDAWHLTSMTRS